MAFKRSAVRSRLSPPKEIRFRKEADFLLCRKFQFPGVFRETLATYLDKTLQHSKLHKLPGKPKQPCFTAEKVKLYPDINYYQPPPKSLPGRKSALSGIWHPRRLFPPGCRRHHRSAAAKHGNLIALRRCFALLFPKGLTWMPPCFTINMR